MDFFSMDLNTLPKNASSLKFSKHNAHVMSFRQFCKSPESHTHSEDTGADTTVIRDLVANDGSGCGIHNEPDIGFDPTDFDIGFIGSKNRPFFVGVLVNKRFHADSCGLAVISDLLVGNADVVQVSESLGGFPKGEAKVDV